MKTSANSSNLKKFEKIQKENLRKVEKLVEKYDSSSSEEEDLQNDNILDNLFKEYPSVNKTHVLKTQTYIENFLQSGSSICVICISSIKRTDSIWSCKNCYTILHLNCIKRWGNDSIAQQKLHLDQDHGYYNNEGIYIPKRNKPLQWYCPNCRKEHKHDEIPKLYECFCGKELNPPYHPWLIPHSCGQHCEKYLISDCGHKCLLLCHPGPCPPCPQSIFTSCKCRRSQPKSIRCFQKNWSCEQKCEKILPCGIHKCEEKCHDIGNCPSCMKKSKQKCLCGNEIKERNCYELSWQCNKICNKLLPCGVHTCKKVCHGGDCEECYSGLTRSCPCGKSKSTAPCTESIESCGDTCQKLLKCGNHYCTMRCHKSECSQCLIIVQKKCRCGLHTKELPCSKIFTCETKCKQMKECGKHVCNKKCCDGQCPPCDKVCNKTLSCRKHKCKSICHDGPCYPCNLKSHIKCRCGQTSITVPCGHERKTKPPKCRQPCRIPSKCHHQNPHNCHFNDCPPCSQKCGLKNDTTNCDHVCEAKCHEAIKVPNYNKTKSIWDWNQNDYEFKKMPHPKCEVKVMVTCIGGHEICLWPCWNSKPTSCQKLCGRLLKCTNHYCQKICHSVVNLSDMNEQDGCSPCNEYCQVPRPNGCPHPCRKPCHPPPCQSCNVTIKSNCFCGISQVFFKCSEYNNENTDKNQLDALREKLKCCGNRCMKNYPCGHRCTSVCHSGDCPNPENCKKKMKIFCNCKNLKTEVTCEKYRCGQNQIPCDDNCLKKKQLEEKIKKQEEEAKRKIEDERNRLELEMFEKKFAKKKFKERKSTEKVPQKQNNQILFIASGIIVLAVVFIFYYLM